MRHTVQPRRPRLDRLGSQRHVDDGTPLDLAVAQRGVTGAGLLQRQAARDDIAVVDDALVGQVDNSRQVLASARPVGAEDRLRAAHGAIDLHPRGLHAGPQADRHHAATIGQHVQSGGPGGRDAQRLEGDVNALAAGEPEDLLAGVLGDGSSTPPQRLLAAQAPPSTSSPKDARWSSSSSRTTTPA